jgi:outer membrane protein insertion porin family
MKVVAVSRLFLAAVTAAVTLGWAAPAAAQAPPCPAPANLPPTGSPVLLRCMHLIAHPVNETVVEQQTYDYYIKTKRTDSATKVFAPYDEASIKADFWSLWRTGFLDNLWIEVLDEPYANGVDAKHVVFHIEERARVKAVDYMPALGTKTQVETSKIEDQLKEKNVRVNLDSFVDEATIRRVKGIIREVYAEKGYQDVTIEHKLAELPAGPKLVHLTFIINQGPKYKIKAVAFDGNTAFSDSALRSQLKENKPKNWYSFLTSSGTYLEAKFADDADKVQVFYLNKGYVRARVGQPQIETVSTSKDGKTRWIRLRIPVDEGMRYNIGKFDIADNTALRSEFLRAQFKIKEGDVYNYSKISKGLEKARDAYGTLGFWQAAPDVDLAPRGIDMSTGLPIGPGEPPPIVDVTVRMIEGKQFFVNKITFLGNTTTHDNVARREMRVLEGGVFNTDALKQSIRRLNQLGYFKPLEGKEDEMSVVPTPGKEGLVDIRLKFQEQNRNQISFGAGVSQFDGFFGQLSFQTSNFLGRGETFAVNLQKGSRARQYQVSFSEPYLLDRPITVGTDVYARQFIYDFQYTQDAKGTNFVLGFPLADYTRLFMTYSYEKIRVYDINEAYLNPIVLGSSPILRESLLIDQGGQRRVSKITPSLVYNTINQPIFPSEGKRATASLDIAGLGGNTQYFQLRMEGIWYIPLEFISRRVSLGLRGEGQWIRPYGNTVTLPIFEKMFLGGEYSVRGFDIRTIGPRDPFSNIVTGGNKSLLFNGELYFNVGGPVRVLAFYDAGQVRDIRQNFAWTENITQIVNPEPPFLTDPFATVVLSPPGTNNLPTVKVIDTTNAFKTSTGFEVRFFMPVLNVPFRLIGAYNPSRRGILTTNFQPVQKFTFRFAVGTTF